MRVSGQGVWITGWIAFVAMLVMTFAFLAGTPDTQEALGPPLLISAIISAFGMIKALAGSAISSAERRGAVIGLIFVGLVVLAVISQMH